MNKVKGDNKVDGILDNSIVLKHYEDNLIKRPYCSDCWNNRIDYKVKDQKSYQSYSTLGPGFSSRTITLPLEVLIVAEAHGGEDSNGFCSQRSLEEELYGFEDYYMYSKIEKFHQQQVRIFLKELNRLDINWVFTDLIKCFVWEKVDGDLKGKVNKRIAINHCGRYLEDQIEVLKPKIIVSLGKTVASYFQIKGKVNQGDIFYYKDSKVIFSFFPSQRTADKWALVDGWEPILHHVKKNILEKTI